MTTIPLVQSTPTDLERLALIEHLARGLQVGSHGCVVAMTGGSALRLCHDLTRPSFDLDVDVSSGDRDWLRVVERAIEQSAWTDSAVVDRKQGGRGYIRVVVDDGEGEWRTKVDVRVCDGAHHSAITRADCAMVRGLVVRQLDHIAERKRDKLYGSNYRQQGRDLYDYAWLIANHPEAVPVEDRDAFRSWLLNWSSRDESEWAKAVETDRALKGIDAVAVLESVYDLVENDPGLRYRDVRDAEGASMAVRRMSNGMVRVGYETAGNFVPLGVRSRAEAACRFAMAHELEDGRGAEHVADVLRSAGVPKIRTDAFLERR